MSVQPILFFKLTFPLAAAFILGVLLLQGSQNPQNLDKNGFSMVSKEEGKVLATVNLNLQVQGDDDDANETDAGSGFARASTSARMYSDTTASSRYNAGHRFTGVNVPQGAFITSATLEFYRYSRKYNDANVDIFADDVDNSVDFFANADVTSRVRTTASAPWIETNIGAGWNPVPTDISPVVQEIVDRSGWVSGNALTILVDGRADFDQLFRSRTRDYSSGTNYGAKLSITYTESFPDPPAIVGAGATPDGAFVNSVSDPLVSLRIRDSGPVGTYPNTYHWNQFQVYKDNGDGTFNAITDTLVQENSESQLPMVEANYPPGGEVETTFWMGGETSGQIFFWRARLNNNGSDFSSAPPESISPWSSAWSFTVDNDAPVSTTNQPPCDVASGPASLVGTASDALSGVAQTAVVIQRQSDGFYWDWGGSSWANPGSPLWSYAVGTTSWSIDTSGVAWITGQDYTVFSSAEDNVIGNFNQESPPTSLIFTIGTCDLQITDITYVPVSDAANPTESGVTISANVSVKNFGTVGISSSFNISFCWDNSSIPNCTATTLSPESVSGILADETKIVPFSFTAPTVAGLTSYTGKATADSGNAVLESDETNNEDPATFFVIPVQPDACTKTTLGDVGAKGKVESCDQGATPVISNAEYLVIADSTITTFYSSKSWLVGNYNGGINTGFTFGNEFDELWDQFGAGAASDHSANGVIPDTRGVYAYPSAAAIDGGPPTPPAGDFTWNSNTVPANSNPVVLFINGDLNIDKNLDLGSKKVVFVVRGDVDVEGSLGGGGGGTLPYAIHAAGTAPPDGILDMKSTTQITGNVYANGCITGGSLDCANLGGDSATIMGDVFVGGDIAAGIYVSGEENTGEPPLDLPDIGWTSWRDTANGADDQRGTTVLSWGGDQELGPTKINGNLTIDGIDSLTINGPVYITGNLIYDGKDTQISLNDSLGSQGTGIVVDGTIGTFRSINISKTSAGGPLFIVSTDPTSNATMEIQNITGNAVFYSAGTMIPRTDGGTNLTGAILGPSVIFGSSGTNITYDPDLAGWSPPTTPDVTSIDGFYVSGGTFNSGVAKAPIAGDCLECQLVVNGGVIAFGGVNLDRNLGTSSSTDPAVIFNYKPEYIYIFATISTLGEKSLLGDDKGGFEEISP